MIKLEHMIHYTHKTGSIDKIRKIEMKEEGMQIEYCLENTEKICIQSETESFFNPLQIAEVFKRELIQRDVSGTFINALAGKACAKTGNKPGVTKGKQWIRLNKQVELLDTPGILWPKFEDQEVGLKLAFIGSIKDEVLQTEELAAELIHFLRTAYPEVLTDKYNIEMDEDDYVVLNHIAKSRNCIVRGNELDTEKAALLLLDDFRNGKLGRLTLEYPQEI